MIQSDYMEAATQEPQPSSPEQALERAMEIIDTLHSKEDKRQFITERIIPEQNRRIRGSRDANQSGEDVRRKLWNVRQKPGEIIEFISALINSREFHGGVLTEELAHEVADLIYYTLQPNSPYESYQDIRGLENGFEQPDISEEQALDICILKYLVRIAFTYLGASDKQKLKRFELKVLQEYLAPLQ